MNKYECACERGQNCTRTSMCAVQSAVEEMEADLKRMTKLNQENGDITEELQARVDDLTSENNRLERAWLAINKRCHGYEIELGIRKPDAALQEQKP